MKESINILCKQILPTSKEIVHLQQNNEATQSLDEF